MVALNTRYLTTNRGVIKLIQIIAGIAVSVIMCNSVIGNRNCFGEGRVGFATGLNTVALILNIIFFLINFLDVVVYKIERLYSVLATIGFLIASGLLIWFLIEYNVEKGRLISATVLVVVQFFLFLFDVKILQGEIAN